MPAGSIAFVLVAAPRWANKTKMERRALTVNYFNGSMRQQKNLMLSIHPSKMLVKQTSGHSGFGFCEAGHLFARDPRMEMERHYSPAHDDREWMEREISQGPASDKKRGVPMIFLQLVPKSGQSAAKATGNSVSRRHWNGGIKIIADATTMCIGVRMESREYTNQNTLTDSSRLRRQQRPGRSNSQNCLPGFQ